MTEIVNLTNKWSYVKYKDVQVSHLHPVDGFLCLKEEDPQLWIRNNQADTLSVRHLELQFHGVEMINDSIGELSNLTHLSITYGGSLNCLPNTILSMHSLQYLYLHGCKSLYELPHNIGNLENLTHLCLSHCETIKSLPASVVKLSKLSNLTVEYCKSLSELPAIPSVVELTLSGCCITTGCLYRGQCLPFCTCVEVRLANLKDFVSLRHLTYGCGFLHMHHQFPENMDKLQHLLFVDIHFSNVKWLPHCITKLSKLRFLFLPQIFRVETLPFHLNDSLVISVEYTHVRKSWKELKTEMLELFSSPIVGVDPSEYLPLKGDPAPWIWNNYHLHSLVRILDLELFHIYDPCAGYLSHLPHTFTRLTHITLYGCEIGVGLESLFDSLKRLSTLESLQLDFEKFPTDVMNLPDSLKRLTLSLYLTEDCGHCKFLPECMMRLSKLKTLELFEFHLVSLPATMNPIKLKLMDSTIMSLPIGLQHLEIIHSGHKCYEDGCCEELQMLLNNQLNSIETLSVTCNEIKFFPELAGLDNLQELQLKDCFNLEELPPNMDELIKLCTINVSGTRIKSLPDSIRKLPNLQHIILPKCFRIESLPSDFKKEFNMFSIDDTYDKYDANMYNDSPTEASTKTSTKHGETTAEINEVLLNEPGSSRDQCND